MIVCRFSLKIKGLICSLLAPPAEAKVLSGSVQCVTHLALSVELREGQGVAGGDAGFHMPVLLMPTARIALGGM